MILQECGQYGLRFKIISDLLSWLYKEFVPKTDSILCLHCAIIFLIYARLANLNHLVITKKIRWFIVRSASDFVIHTGVAYFTDFAGHWDQRNTICQTTIPILALC